MNIAIQKEINAPKERVWQIITDIENSVNTIEGINAVEVLEKPESGVVGLKWRETRIMFGKEAQETMWITEAEKNHFYETRAESHGMVYETKLSVMQEDDTTILSMSFTGTPQTVMGKIMSPIMGMFFKGATRKALAKDLEDIAAAATA